MAADHLPVFGNARLFDGISMGSTTKLQLGELTFDANTRQLLRGSAEVHLSPKAFDLLSYLIAERPRALSKNELHARLWPATFVSETNLASLIAEVREALGDVADRPRFIRTARRFGYAFCDQAVETVPPVFPEGGLPFCWLIIDGRRLPLEPGDNIIGRDEQGIFVDSPTVSRRHARITITAGGALLEDLGSKNGTSIRGVPVSTPVGLADGDEIRVGSVALHFRITKRQGETATWRLETADQ